MVFIFPLFFKYVSIKSWKKLLLSNIKIIGKILGIKIFKTFKKKKLNVKQCWHIIKIPKTSGFFFFFLVLEVVKK